MAADVQDIEPDPPTIERNDVQAVAGKLVARSVDPREGHAWDGG